MSAEAQAASVAQTPITAGKTLSGVIGTGGTGALNAFGHWRGKPVDVTVSFIGASTWSSMTGISAQRLPGYFAGSSAHRVWSVPLLPLKEAASLQTASTGGYNDKYRSIAQQLVATGEASSTIRLGWEMTGDWYPWSGAKDPAAFVGAWRQAVTAMRGVPGAHFTFDWNPSIGFANPEPMYPGDSYVDFIGTDVYDQSFAWSYPASDHTQVWNHFLTMQYGLNWLSSFADSHGKRITIPEWGVAQRCDGHGGGDDPYFVQQLMSWMAAHDVAYESYQNQDDNSCQRYSITDGAFPQSSSMYKRQLAAPAAAPAPIPQAAVTLDDHSVRASAVSSRSGSWTLQGSTLGTPSSHIFVTPPADTVKVEFYLDRPMSAGPTHTENSAPWDLVGGTTSTADPLPLSSLANGSHTLIVTTTSRDGGEQTATMTFRAR